MAENKIILLVDDTPDNLTILSTLLKSHYQLKIAINGEKAIKIVQSENPPDLILLDVMMPGMDGFEVCKILKSSEQTSHIPIIFLTGLNNPEDIKKGKDLGGIDFLTKPINPNEVLKKVQNQLNL